MVKRRGHTNCEGLLLLVECRQKNGRLKKAKFYCNVAASEFSMCEASKLTVMEYYNMLKSKGVFTSKMELEERSSGFRVI